VAGDFNSSETFDSPKPRGNREFMERMNGLGLTEGLRACTGQLTPTFRTPRGGFVVHQLDHLYVTEALRRHLTECGVGSAQRVFESARPLSDHLPIVADFTLPV
jgi:endonuclease/exonuclease/phosphatase family metal-dependent hydrolase